MLQQLSNPLLIMIISICGRLMAKPCSQQASKHLLGARFGQCIEPMHPLAATIKMKLGRCTFTVDVHAPRRWKWPDYNGWAVAWCVPQTHYTRAKRPFLSAFG